MNWSHLFKGGQGRDPDELANACIAFGVACLLVGIVWVVWYFAT